MKSKMILLISFVLAITLFYGNATLAAENNVLRIHQEQPPKILMPLITAGREEEYVFELMYARLNRIDEEGKIVSGMANNWKISDDKLTWTFNLRHDLKWQDGQPITAQDVEFTVYSYSHPDIGKWWNSTFTQVVGASEYYKGETNVIKGAKVIDDYTIAFTTKVKNAAFPSVFVDTKIIPKHIWKDVEKTETAYNAFANTPKGQIGSGPYKLIKHVTDQYMEFARNENYYRGVPKIKKLFLMFSPIDTGMAMLETGEADLVFEVSYTDIARLEKIKGITIETTPNANWIWWVRFCLHEDNPSPIKEFLLNPKFRKAITYALDRQAYVDAILLGHGKVIASHAYSIPWTVPNDLKLIPYDPEKAKEILKEIGWNFKNDKIRILLYPSNKARNQLATILQNYLKNIGVNAIIDSKDLAAARVDFYETHDYDLAVGGWLQGTDPSLWACNLASIEAGGGKGNEGYSNPEVDQLFKEGLGAFDFNERQKIYQQLVRVVHEDMPRIPVVLSEVVIARTNRLKNYILAPGRRLGARFPDIYKWEITDK